MRRTEFELCHGEKGYHEMEPTLRVSQSCCIVNNKIQRFALDIPTDCPCEALFIVVSLAATLGQHGPRRGDVPAKLFHYMALFLAMA